MRARNRVRFQYIKDRGYEVTAWPRKRGKPANPNQKFTVELFQYAQWLFKFVDPASLGTATLTTEQTGWYPRDLLLRAVTGNWIEVELPDGSLLLGEQATMQSPTNFLDLISQTPGAILYRGEIKWSALAPGAAGNVLTSQGPGNAPTWATGGGGGGGSIWYMNPPSAGDFTLLSADATNLALTDNADAGLLIDGGAPVTGDKKRFAYQSIASPSTDWTATARLQYAIDSANYSYVGLLAQDGATGKCFSAIFNSTGGITATTWPGLSGYTLQNGLFTPRGPMHWLQLAKVGTNLVARCSPDGKQWLDVATVAIASALTNNPTRVGLFVGYNKGSGYAVKAACEYWSFT